MDFYFPSIMIDLSVCFSQLLKKTSLQYIFYILSSHGIEGRLVGGCVRDSILKQKISDIDIAVNVPPEIIQELFENKGVSVIPTGIHHGTVTIILNQEAFELTSLREDISTDGRHAVIAYTKDWRRDAERRDFTINAFYLDKDGQIYDYFKGLEDLSKGIIRFIGNPEQRIREDYLRILRYYRFALRFGKYCDLLSYQAVQKHIISLRHLSKERIQSELFKILVHSNPQNIIQSMEKDGVFQTLFKEKAHTSDLEKFVVIQKKQSKQHKNLLEISRLFCMFPHNIDFFKNSLCLSRFHLQSLKILFKNKNILLSNMHLFEIQYRYGYELAKIWLDFQVMQLLKKNNEEISVYQKFYKQLNTPLPSFPLKGSDLLNLGFNPGEKLGYILKQCEQQWLLTRGKLSKDECLNFAKSFNK